MVDRDYPYYYTFSAVHPRRFVDNDARWYWLRDNLGLGADNWYSSWNANEATYYFRNSEDHALFVLIWA